MIVISSKKAYIWYHCNINLYPSIRQYKYSALFARWGRGGGDQVKKRTSQLFLNNSDKINLYNEQ